MTRTFSGAAIAMLGAAFMVVAIIAIEYKERVAPALNHAAQSLNFTFWR